MAETPHDRFAEAPALYAIGALPADERAAFEAHVRDCPTCTDELRRLLPVVLALPLALPDIEPPSALRDRVLSAAVRRRVGNALPPQRVRGETGNFLQRARVEGWWLATAAAVVLAIGLAAVWTSAVRARLDAIDSALREARDRLTRNEERSTIATREAADAQAQLAVLTASDLRQVALAGQPTAPGASGRAFLSPSHGVLFAASNLPALPAGRTYQLWYLTTGAPVSAGLFKPDSSGRAVLALAPPTAVSAPAGLAVSIEPDGGVAAPTGAIYLAGTTH